MSSSIRVLSSLVLAGLCLTAAAGTSWAQVATGIVQGTVFMTDPDGTRSPIPGATVFIKGSGPSQQATTDEHAMYRFTGLAPGQYQLEANAPGLTGSNSAMVDPSAVANVSIE